MRNEYYLMSLNPLDKYSKVDPSGDWVELSWWMTKYDHKKRIYLHNKLFGRATKVNDKLYYYDGVLMGWKEVNNKFKRVKLHDYNTIGQAHIVVPKELQPILDTIFSSLEVDHRWHPYMPRKNLVVVY